MKRSARFSAYSTGVLSLLILAGLTLTSCAGTPDQEARHKLDSLLGQGETPTPLPGTPPPEASSPGIPSLGSLFGFQLPQAGVDIQETAANYTLRVPLADPQDAEQIRLKVTPHRIEISGQTDSQKGGARITSSFMQTFATSTEVLPDQIKRRTERQGEQTELVITIPKKTAGSPATPAPPDRLPGQPPAGQEPIDPSLFDGQQPQVI